MNNLQNTIGDYEQFLTSTLTRVEQEGFDVADFTQLDVLCYRTSSQDNYVQKKKELSKIGELLSEAIVSGRPIATFRLNDPIYYAGWRIDAIELPAPKAGSEKPEGLEHIQFVLYDDLKTFMQKHQDKEFDTRAIDRDINPMIAYKFKGGAVKFHILSLPVAIYLEKKLGVKKV